MYGDHDKALTASPHELKPNSLFWARSQACTSGQHNPVDARRHSRHFLSDGRQREGPPVSFQPDVRKTLPGRTGGSESEGSMIPTCGGVGVEEGWPTGGVEFLLPDPPAMISSVISLPP